MYFMIGDYLAGMLIGAATALGVHAAVFPGMDMVVAMLLGMALGMLIHLTLGLLLAPLLGMFQVMIPAAIIGTYGGMLFGMRDSIDASPSTPGAEALVGMLFGAFVVLGVRLYDRILQGAVLDTDE